MRPWCVGWDLHQCIDEGNINIVRHIHKHCVLVLFIVVIVHCGA